MKIETKLNLKDTCYFLTQNAVRQSKIVRIEVRIAEDKCDILYTVESNPAGGQYKTMFNEHEIFLTKEELLKTL